MVRKPWCLVLGWEQQHLLPGAPKVCGQDSSAGTWRGLQTQLHFVEQSHENTAWRGVQRHYKRQPSLQHAGCCSQQLCYQHK